MAVSKATRLKVFNKYGGKCAYCGCDLDKKWCIDHIEPILRQTKMVGNTYVTPDGNAPTEVDFETGNYQWVPPKSVPDGCRRPELDTIENYTPACFSCNHYKSTMTLETFREQVGKLVGRLNHSFSQYKIAKRFGLIEETGRPVVFYFETVKQEST